MRFFLTIPALLLAVSAAGKEAPKDRNGLRFCLGENRALDETADGHYEFTVHITIPGDLDHAQYPGGKVRLVRTDMFPPSISTGYRIKLGKDGQPLGKPRPFAVTTTLGRFDGERPGPKESLSIRIQAATQTSPDMPLDQFGYQTSVPIGAIRTPDTKSKDSLKLGAEVIADYVRGIENDGSTVLLLQNGTEIARIPFPKPDIQAQVQAKFAWAQTTAKALTARGSCE